MECYGLEATIINLPSTCIGESSIFLPWLTFGLTLILGGFGWWVANAQKHIASAKVKLDLYNKRFAVYESAVDFYLAYYEKAAIPLREAETIFIKRYRESQFLFSSEDGIYDTLGRIKEFVGVMSAHHQQAQGGKCNVNPITHMRSNDAADQFEPELKKLEDQMGKYLSFRTIDGWRRGRGHG